MWFQQLAVGGATVQVLDRSCKALVSRESSCLTQASCTRA